jgi:hypothetical protein
MKELKMSEKVEAFLLKAYPEALNDQYKTS